MQIETIQFSGYGDKQLNARLWLPDSAPIGILQITHGMTEHIGRWETFAKALCQIGFAVAGFDLRGHGADQIQPGIASLGSDGWDASLEDMHCLFTFLQKRFPSLPHFMLGFSLGSFLLREYLGQYSESISGAILLGTGQQPGILLGILQAIIHTQINKVGWDATTPLVRKLSFETYNQKFAPNRTTADWLCSDEQQLDTYLQDPLCREHISAGLFWQLLGSMKRCGSAGGCSNWDKATPILLLSGASDPVGDMGKGVLAVQRQLQRAGLQQIELQLLPGCRHDLIHEERNGAAAKARKIICRWLIGHCKK